MAAILIVLFFLTFLFHTGVGLCFLALAIVVLVKNGASNKLTIVRGERATATQPSWTDPWRTENLR